MAINVYKKCISTGAQGITKKNVEDLINSGVNVITSGNHIWDQKEILEVISNDKRVLRPENLLNNGEETKI